MSDSTTPRLQAVFGAWSASEPDVRGWTSIESIQRHDEACRNLDRLLTELAPWADAVDICDDDYRHGYEGITLLLMVTIGGKAVEVTANIDWDCRFWRPIAQVYIDEAAEIPDEDRRRLDRDPRLAKTSSRRRQWLPPQKNLRRRAASPRIPRLRRRP